MAPVLDFAAKVRQNGQRCPARDAVRDWDVDVVAMLIAGKGCAKPPCVAPVHWVIDLDEVRRRYSWVVQRDDATYPLVLQSGWQPGETPEQVIRREAVMGVLAAVLTASYEPRG